MENQTPEQGAPAPSVEDKVASLFGATPETQETAPELQTEAVAQEAPAEPETLEIEYEGERFAIPKKLEKAIMQEKDYTQKSQELANIRRQVEAREQQVRIAAMHEAFNREVSTERQNLALYDAAIAEANKVNWAQMSTDEIIRKKLEIDQWKEQRDALAKSVEGKQAEWNQKLQAEVANLRAVAEEALKKRVPNWSPEVMTQVKNSALSDGYTAEELSQIIDPRHAITLWKAHMYDQSQKKATEAVKQVQSAAVQAKSSRPMDASTKDYLNYRKERSRHAIGSPERQRMAQDRVAKLFGG